MSLMVYKWFEVVLLIAGLKSTSKECNFMKGVSKMAVIIRSQISILET